MKTPEALPQTEKTGSRVSARSRWYATKWRHKYTASRSHTRAHGMHVSIRTGGKWPSAIIFTHAGEPEGRVRAATPAV
ncbi:hypothetical protein V5799_031559 [Amblyomma americanum]|uniref:Uncharacterized protein n=1 Tax=Amblyomma americanum TaxID=6943 RepID=A0AAQ4DTN8_AMBAM